jgi:DNA-binding NtrC family response regulator
MMRYPNVLLFSADEGETGVLQEILDRHAVVTPVHNQSELAEVLKNDSFDALFWSWSIRAGNWSDALREVHAIDSTLPVIVLSNEAEERAWLRALNAGAFDLLVAPFDGAQLVAVLEQASASHEARVARTNAAAPVHGAASC